MARIGTTPAKLQGIAKIGNVAETLLKGKQSTKGSYDKVKTVASKTVNIRMQTEDEPKRLPLKQVVTECTKRWFQETLKEAKSGDTEMQVLVGQMYSTGYGTAQDKQKGQAWFQKATKSRLKNMNLCAKPPGYNVTDSDSDDQNKHQK